MKMQVVVLAVALAAGGCAENPYIRQAETRGVVWGVVGTTLVAGMLYSIFSYRQQQAAGARYVPSNPPVGAKVVACPSGVPASTICWIMPDEGVPAPAGKKASPNKWQEQGGETGNFKSEKKGEPTDASCAWAKNKAGENVWRCRNACGK